MRPSQRLSIALTAIICAGLLAACSKSALEKRAAAHSPAAPIRVGELMSYTQYAEVATHWKRGWQLALDEVNAAGGIHGRPLEVVSRDDGGNPNDAVRVAEELTHRDGACLLFGTIFDHVSLAVSDFAKRSRIILIKGHGGTDRLIREAGHRYFFRIQPSVSFYADLLAEEAARWPAKRWATIAPNYEFGHASVESFQKALTRLRPDVEWVSQAWPMLGKLDPGPTVQALLSARPDAIFNATFTGDTMRLLRQGKSRGLFEGRPVASMFSGLPEFLDQFGAEVPQDWLTSGYPAEEISAREHKAFAERYYKRYGESPREGSLVGYVTLKAVATLLTRANSTESERLVDTLAGMQFETPIGPLTFDVQTHQSNMGTWIGKTALVGGKPAFLEGKYQAPKK